MFFSEHAEGFFLILWVPCSWRYRLSFSAVPVVLLQVESTPLTGPEEHF